MCYIVNDLKLIALVRKEPAIYDPLNAKYTDTEFKSSFWDQLGDDLNVDGRLCKSRWSNIRDNFRKSLIKRKARRGEQMKRYKYSRHLQFLVPFFENRDLTGLKEEETSEDNVSEPSDVDDDEVAPDLVTAEVNGQMPTVVATSSWAIPENRMKTDDATSQTAAEALAEYILRKNDKTPAPSQDPVDAFLAGVAPALKKLPPKEWFHARREIFDVVQKYEIKLLENSGFS